MSERNVKLELYTLCDSVIKGATNREDALTTIRTQFLDVGSSLSSDLFDIIAGLASIPLEGEKKENATKFFKLVAEELLPDDSLKLELPQLGAESFRQKVIKTKTKIYYKQLKFNLFREESEGYAKLVTELLTVEPEDDPKSTFNRLSQLIGQFNLDPNRVIDLLIDCFACNFRSHRVFVDVLKLLNIETEVLKKTILLKFILFQKSGHTSNAFYRVVVMLVVVEMLNWKELFLAIHPTRETFAEEVKEQRKMLANRISKSETISTLATIQSEESASNGMSSGINDGLSNSMSSASVQARSFSSVTNAQEIEDLKASGDSFDEYLILEKNQKLGLLVAAAEIGSLKLVCQMVPLFPESYPLGTSKRFAKALCHILEYIIDPFYKLKYQSTWSDKLSTTKGWNHVFVERPEQVEKWEDLSTRIIPLLKILGPYLGVNREVAIKFMRLLNTFFADEKTQSNSFELINLIYSIVDFCLLPSLSIGEPSFTYNEELWAILSRVPYQGRYWMYGRWKTTHSVDNYELQLQRGKVIGQMKYIMKRMTKETIKVAGRQLGKVCLKHPTVAFDYMLDRVQSFQNLIGPVVESMRYLSDLSFDVLTYSLIEALSQPSKQGLKTGDGTLSSWLVALASFSGAVYRRYTVEYEGILQYITNQLKDGKSVDLMILREVITSTAGFEPTSSLTNDQLDALCSGEVLRQEVIGTTNQKGKRQAISRLRDALLHTDLCESLTILLAQQKNCVIYNETKDAPVKLTSQMVDQCQDTFMQFVNFLRFNIKSDEYLKRIPLITSLLRDYHVPSEAAFFLARPNYTNKAIGLYESSKKIQKETAETKKLDSETKNELYVQSLTQVMNSVEEELCLCMPEQFWTDLSAKVYTIFWLLSINDIRVSTSLYNQEAERIRKEITDLPKSDISKSRRAKEEDRLKSLEQKIVQELSRQEEHVNRVKTLLTNVKEDLFAKNSTAQNSQISNFIQFCLFPRCVFSEVDAVYCAQFINILHSLRTGYFTTIVLFDKIFADITPVLSSLSENEAASFGKFISLLLEIALKWHGKKEIYEAECAGYPGCLSKLRNAQDAFKFEDFRTVCFKWQIRLNRTLGQALGEKSSYSVVRNAFLILNKLLNQFPLITTHMADIERAATLVRDREKNNRMDLSVMAQSYLVHLKKRTIKVYETNEFHSPATVTPSSKKGTPSDKTANPAKPPTSTRTTKQPSTPTRITRQPSTPTRTTKRRDQSLDTKSEPRSKRRYEKSPV